MVELLERIVAAAQIAIGRELVVETKDEPALEYPRYRPIEEARD